MRTKIQNINDDARLNHWKQIIQECRNSGLPVKTWCYQNNVSEPSDARIKTVSVKCES